MFKSKLKKMPKIQILPMIDVIFFLLVFFMLFTTFKTTPHGFDLKLPKATTVNKSKSVNIVVNISEEGHFFLKDKQVSHGELENKVKKKLIEKPNTTVIIKADEKAKYKYLVKAMDLISQAGGTKFSLAAEKDNK